MPDCEDLDSLREETRGTDEEGEPMAALSYETWHEHAHHQANMRGILARIGARCLHRDLAAGFYGWYDRTKKLEEVKSLVDEFILRWEHKVVFRVFVRWSMLPEMSRMRSLVMKGITLKKQTEEYEARGRRQIRCRSVPPMTRSTRSELIARLERTWMTFIEKYWATMEEECLEAKKWYNFHRDRYLHKCQNNDWHPLGHMLDQDFFKDEKEPEYETFDMGVASIFSSFTKSVGLGRTCREVNLSQDFEQLKQYCAKLEEENNRLQLQRLHPPRAAADSKMFYY